MDPLSLVNPVGSLGEATEVHDAKGRAGGGPGERLRLTAIVEAGPDHGSGDEGALIDNLPRVTVG